MREHGQLVLCRDGGGTWRLDAPRKANGLTGQRVRMTGTRADFDLLDVTHIEVTTKTTSKLE